MVAPAIPNLLSRETIERALRCDDAELQEWVRLAAYHPYYTFEPRPDVPEDYDEQTAFVDDTTSRFAICLGGTGSGKTMAAAYKTARFVLENRPRAPLYPFWIVGEVIEQICQVGWVEKLSKLIPETEILAIQWEDSKRRHPRSVILRHPDDRNSPGWVLEFKSYEQGIGSMKGVAIGGYWFNEEVPYSIVAEVQGRTRETGCQGWADFTPVECKSPEWIDAYENPPEGWKFYHLNSLLNTALEPGWAEWYLSQVPEDTREMRQIGKFAVLRGAVFKEWRKSIHVVDPEDATVQQRLGLHRRRPYIPHDWRKFRGIDFGYNDAFCCLWVARDHDGRYYVYDEHFEGQQLLSHHARKISEREWSDHLPWYGQTYADHQRQERAEMAAMGIVTTPAVKMVNEGNEALRSLMMPQGDGRPRIYVFANCKNLVREIPGYKWSVATTNRSAKDEPIDKDNHAIDALRYVVHSEQVGRRFGAPASRREIRDARRHGVHLEKRR